MRRASLDGDCMVMMLATDMLSFLPFKMLITVTYRLSCRKMQHFLHFCLFQQVEDVERTAPAHETLRKECVPNLPGPIHIAVDRQGRLSSRTPSAAMPLSQLPNMKQQTSSARRSTRGEMIDAGLNPLDPSRLILRRTRTRRPPPPHLPQLDPLPVTLAPPITPIHLSPPSPPHPLPTLPPPPHQTQSPRHKPHRWERPAEPPPPPATPTLLCAPARNLSVDLGSQVGECAGIVDDGGRVGCFGG